MLRFKQVLSHCLLGFGLATALYALPAGAYAHMTVLYGFKGGADGLTPSSNVLFDNKGNLYGTTWNGGGIGCNVFGCGTVFKLTPNGDETLIYSFQGGVGDGYSPSNIIRDGEGNFYGTTYAGGLQDCDSDCGTVFKIAPDGKETVLHFFAGGDDGANPAAGLVRDKSGSLYGTTKWGGGTLGDGTVFRIAPDGAETVLYRFCSMPHCADGAGPSSDLIADSAGNLYGTTSFGGGVHDGTGGGGGGDGGTLFRLSKDGTLKVLYSFCSQMNCQDGSDPEAGVVLDAAGNLYGTTFVGGKSGCAYIGTCGTVFEVQADGKARTLHAFDSAKDGGNPVAKLVMDQAGNLYGAIRNYSATLCNGKPGVVFRLAPDGSEKLYCIPSAIAAGVIEKNGILYGAATGADNFKYQAGFVFAVRQ